MRRLEPRHWIYVLVHALAIVLGFGLCYGGGPILTAIGSSIIAAGITGYIIFVYVFISDATSRRLDLLNQFGFVAAFEARAARIKSEYDVRLDKAHDAIYVAGFGLSSLREDYSDHFPSWKQKAKIRFLLIDPEFPSKGNAYASQRDLEENNFEGKIEKDVKEFVRATRSLIEADRFEVRLYRCLPTVNIFRIDDELFWGPYLVKNASRNLPTFVVKRGGILFETCLEHFESIWNDAKLSRPAPEDWLKQ